MMIFNSAENLVLIGDPHIGCNGIILFRLNQEKRELETLLVKTHKGHLGFPKGKRKFKKNETRLEAAFREVEEETGLKPNQYRLLTDESNQPRWLVELSFKGKPSIELMIGLVNGDVDEKEITFDPEELLEVKWYNVKEVLKLEEELFYSKRKIVLRDALKLMAKALE